MSARFFSLQNNPCIILYNCTLVGPNSRQNEVSAWLQNEDYLLFNPLVQKCESERRKMVSFLKPYKQTETTDFLSTICRPRSKCGPKEFIFNIILSAWVHSHVINFLTLCILWCKGIVDNKNIACLKCHFNIM